MSDYVRQFAFNCTFQNSDSWVVLSPIEQRIKEKIERIGTPLKDWNISINYGIKTGYNEAFIINGVKREELIKADPKSAEVIRPILRGRDIKRYGYDFADLWLLNIHNGIKEKGIKPINIEDYPSIKEHLDQFRAALENRLDKGITSYNLRNCAYMDDFSKQKIIYPDIMRMPRQEERLQEYPYFYFDDEGFYVEATNFMMTGEDIDIVYLFLVSDLGFFTFSMFYAGPQFDATGFRYKKAYLDETFIPKPNTKHEKSLRQMIGQLKKSKDLSGEINKIWCDVIGLNTEEIEFINQYKRSLLY